MPILSRWASAVAIVGACTGNGIVVAQVFTNAYGGQFAAVTTAACACATRPSLAVLLRQCYGGEKRQGDHGETHCWWIEM